MGLNKEVHLLRSQLDSAESKFMRPKDRKKGKFFYNRRYVASNDLIKLGEEAMFLICAGM